MSPAVISLIVLAVVLAGVLGGSVLRHALPEHHLSQESKDIVRLGSGLVATIAGLVLGLLISTAKSSFDGQRNQVRQITANVVLLDTLLTQYGPETRAARELLRRAVGGLVQRIWHENRSDAAPAESFSPTVAAELTFAKIQELSPTTDAQSFLKSRATQLSIELAQSRLVLFEEGGGSIPPPFLAVLVFWLAIIFASFSMFSRLNATAAVALFIFALSATGAIFLILEMDQPFNGLMQISKAPLANALALLGMP